MAEQDPNQPVNIAHPDVAAVGGPVPFHAFETVWKDKGWTITSDEPGTPTKASSKSKPANIDPVV